MQGAFALGIASGFLNLIPFLGVVLASLVPLLAATLQFGNAGPFLIHCADGGLFAFAFRQSVSSQIYRLPRENRTSGRYRWDLILELAVGRIGLLLAVPLTAFVRLVADSHPALLPIANLLAETPHPLPRWAQMRHTTVPRAIPFSRDRFRVRRKH
jgi:hypothetical protein